MRNFGSVHDGASLSVRRPVELQTHNKLMILQQKVKWIYGALVDLAELAPTKTNNLATRSARPDLACVKVNGVRARHERDPENRSNSGRRRRRLQPAGSGGRGGNSRAAQ